MRDARLPDHLRRELAKPFGPIVQTKELAEALRGIPTYYCVGDVVSMTAIELGLHPKLIVCDFKTQRGDDDAAFQEVLGAYGEYATRIENPAAMITAAAWSAVEDAIERPGTTRIEVVGEEDLLGIPVIAHAPLGTAMIYGAPGQGMVVAKVDAKLKSRVAEFQAALQPI